MVSFKKKIEKPLSSLRAASSVQCRSLVIKPEFQAVYVPGIESFPIIVREDLCLFLISMVIVVYFLCLKMPDPYTLVNCGKYIYFYSKKVRI